MVQIASRGDWISVGDQVSYATDATDEYKKNRGSIVVTFVDAIRVVVAPHISIMSAVDLGAGPLRRWPAGVPKKTPRPEPMLQKSGLLPASTSRPKLTNTEIRRQNTEL